MYVGDQLTDAASDARCATVNPATEEPLGLAPHAGAADMRQVIAAAAPPSITVPGRNFRSQSGIA